MAIRFPDCMVSEKELVVAMSSAVPLTKIVEWTAVIDDRCLTATIGFFVELAGDQGMCGFPHICSLAHEVRFPLDLDLPVSDLALLPERMLEELARSNKNITWVLKVGIIRKPTARLVRSGTFSEFLQLKVNEGSVSVGQVKVPVVLPKAAYVTWFSNRVVQEL